MGLAHRIEKIVAFFRAGYPTGVPAFGYVPLLALLPRRMTEGEISSVAHKLMTRRRVPVQGVDIVDIGVEITRITHELPSLHDIRQVQRYLAASGGEESRSQS